MYLRKRLTFLTWIYFDLTCGYSRKYRDIWTLRWTCWAMNSSNDLTSSPSACLTKSLKGIFANCERLYWMQLCLLSHSKLRAASMTIPIEILEERRVFQVTWIYVGSFDQRSMHSQTSGCTFHLLCRWRRRSERVPIDFATMNKEYLYLRMERNHREAGYHDCHSHEGCVLLQIPIWLSQPLELMVNWSKQESGAMT